VSEDECYRCLSRHDGRERRLKEDFQEEGLQSQRSEEPVMVDGKKRTSSQGEHLGALCYCCCRPGRELRRLLECEERWLGKARGYAACVCNPKSAGVAQIHRSRRSLSRTAWGTCASDFGPHRGMSGPSTWPTPETMTKPTWSTTGLEYPCS
jgi:hypothetical protein